MKPIHLTLPENAACLGWRDLPGHHGIQISRWPLVEKGNHRRIARLTYDGAQEAARLLGGRVIDRSRLVTLRQISRVLHPVILPDPKLMVIPPRDEGETNDHYQARIRVDMASLEWSEIHDSEVFRLLGEWDQNEWISNIGKHWIDGAPKGRAYLMGWWNHDLGKFIQGGAPPGTQGPHESTHHDYATTTLLERDAPPDGGGGWFDGVKEALGDLFNLPRIMFTPQSMGERAVEWSLRQIGTEEIPGPKHNPLIVAWGSACRRGGQYLGRLRGWIGRPFPISSATDEEAWCAKFASAAMLAVLREGEIPPHSPRVSVAELIQDARTLGTWRDAASGYIPKVGDLECYARKGQDPRTGGSGHVARVERVEPRRTVGGNESPGPGAVYLTDRPGPSQAVGWIVYP